MRVGNGEAAFPDLADRNNSFFLAGILNTAGGVIDGHGVRILPVKCEEEERNRL